MNELHLFAGAGGGILAGQMLGHRTVCAVEWDAYAQSVLVARQNDGCFPPFPIWDDVQTFDGRPWRGIVDIVAGGFPCQDISAAGKGAGIDGERSGMWAHMARVVSEVRPQLVFVENSPMLIHRGLGRVIGDLSALGYDSRWLVMGAADVGAPHQRDRLWILATLAIPDADMQPGSAESRQQQQGAAQLERSGCDGMVAWNDVADADSLRELQPTRREQNQRVGIGKCGSHVANAYGAQRKGNERAQRVGAEHADISSPSWWRAEPELGRVAHGVAHRAHRLKAIGNGQVPQCAAAAFQILYAQIQ